MTNELQKSIDETIDAISEKHRMHRKIQFLLDIRGLLIINHLKGAYAEFGVYRGEMMYAAGKILQDNITKLYGFDTFEGLPDPKAKDNEIFVFEQPGFMKSEMQKTDDLIKDYPRELIAGDFREKEVRAKISKALEPISVLSIDCNWPSSVEASLEIATPYLMSGSIVYFDDYFIGTREGDYTKPLMDKVRGWSFIEFKTYAPCARAFIVVKK